MTETLRRVPLGEVRAREIETAMGDRREKIEAAIRANVNGFLQAWKGQDFHAMIPYLQPSWVEGVTAGMAVRRRWAGWKRGFVKTGGGPDPVTKLAGLFARCHLKRASIKSVKTPPEFRTNVVADTYVIARVRVHGKIVKFGFRVRTVAEATSDGAIHFGVNPVSVLRREIAEADAAALPREMRTNG